MNYFSVTNLVIVAINFPIAVILLVSSKGKKANIYLAYLCLAAVVWGFGSFKYSATANLQSAIFWWQIANVGSIFSTVIFYYFILAYLNFKRPFLSSIINVLTVFYLYINFFEKDVFIGSPKFLFNQFYYLSWPHNQISPYLLYYISFFFFILFYSFFLIINEYIKSSGVRRLQMKYLIVGMVIGFIGCHACFLPVFQFVIYPYLNILIAFYTIPIFYAIVKYRLMDIKIIFTRASIFIFVYALVLGVPLWLGFKLFGYGLWLVPTIFMAVLASIGPSIYLYFQKRAEDKILQEQRRYQSTLRQAATGMGRVKQLKKLLNLVVYVVTRAVHLEHTLIYLRDDKRKCYILSAYKSRKQSTEYIDCLTFDRPIVNYLTTNHNPINCEEFLQKSKDQSDKGKDIEKDIKDMKGELILPVHIEDKLLAYIVFGKKDSGKSFNEEDLAVFSSLTNQIALAIENAQFYEEVKMTQERLFQAEKMATIGTMADGLSHQINNRFHAMGFIAGDALDTIKITKDKGIPDNFKETFDDLERALTRVQENVVQGGEIVQGLLRYTRKGDAGFAAVDFNDVVKSAFEMAQFKIKTNELKIIKDYDNDIPKLKANFTQLQEVFFNLIDNAYDAMMQRKTEKVEIGYQPTLIIRARPQGNFLEIIVEDNGIGVKDDDREKLFTPFFTTKLSSKKGTGLGLYVIRKIIEENHGGSVEMTSRYMINTRMKINLPIVF